jgi:hypothetical protein
MEAARFRQAKSIGRGEKYNANKLDETIDGSPFAVV